MLLLFFFLFQSLYLYVAFHRFLGSSVFHPKVEHFQELILCMTSLEFSEPFMSLLSIFSGSLYLRISLVIPRCTLGLGLGLMNILDHFSHELVENNTELEGELILHLDSSGEQKKDT